MEDKSDNGELDLNGIDEEEIEKVCSLLLMDLWINLCIHFTYTAKIIFFKA